MHPYLSVTAVIIVAMILLLASLFTKPVQRFLHRKTVEMNQDSYRKAYAAMSLGYVSDDAEYRKKLLTMPKSKAQTDGIFSAQRDWIARIAPDPATIHGVSAAKMDALKDRNVDLAVLLAERTKAHQEAQRKVQVLLLALQDIASSTTEPVMGLRREAEGYLRAFHADADPVERLLSAVRFYAQPDNWKDHVQLDVGLGGADTVTCPIGEDVGDAARAALVGWSAPNGSSHLATTNPQAWVAQNGL